MVFMAFNFLFPFGKEVTDIGTINECEAANDNEFINVKSICADIVEKKEGTLPEKIRVWVEIEDSMNYTAFIYYKIDDVWYVHDQHSFIIFVKGLFNKNYRNLDNAIGYDIIL